MYTKFLVIVLGVKKGEGNRRERHELLAFFLEALTFLEEPNSRVTRHVLYAIQWEILILVLKDDISSTLQGVSIDRRTSIYLMMTLIKS